MIRLYGTKGKKYISGQKLRERFKLLSTKFDVYLKFNQINLENKLQFDNKILMILHMNLSRQFQDYFLLVKGYGAGHGVGMSQWGAKAMAERGSSFQ